MKHPSVILYSRKPRSTGNHSIELINQQLRPHLSRTVNLSVIVAPDESRRLIPRLRIMIDAMRQKADILHVTGDINFANILCWRSKTIVTILDCFFLKTHNPFKFFLLKLFWLDLPVRRAHIIVTISEAAKAEIVKYTSCSPEKVKVVYCPLPEDCQYSPKVFSSVRPRILQLGTAANKNLVRTIAALRGIDCELIVVGPVDSKVIHCLQEANVLYQQFDSLSRIKIVEQFLSADIISFCSTYEGFGLPIIEGNAIGRIVVTSNQGAMAEVAANAAILVDPFSVDSIRSGFDMAIHDDVTRELMIRNGLKNIERFQPAAVAGNYLKVFSSMLA